MNCCSIRSRTSIEAMMLAIEPWTCKDAGWYITQHQDAGATADIATIRRDLDARRAGFRFDRFAKQSVSFLGIPFHGGGTGKRKSGAARPQGCVQRSDPSIVRCPGARWRCRHEHSQRQRRPRLQVRAGTRSSPPRSPTAADPILWRRWSKSWVRPSRRKRFERSVQAVCAGRTRCEGVQPSRRQRSAGAGSFRWKARALLFR
jgi:hypothetical protein